MPDFPQDVVDEMDGKTVASSADAPSREDGKDIEVSGEYEPAPDDNDGDEQGPEILNKDQQAVMHRISEAIAHLVYGKDTNQAIIKMALLGPEGVVKAVGAILEKVVMTAKPGIPRELIPMAAFAALVMIQDFLSQMGEKTMPMQEIVPMLVDELAESGELPDKAEFLKIAKKKFPDSKDNTLGIVHGEVSKLVEMLKKAKLLKA